MHRPEKAVHFYESSRPLIRSGRFSAAFVLYAQHGQIVELLRVLNETVHRTAHALEHAFRLGVLDPV